MQRRRKGWGLILVLGAVCAGGLWGAADPWLGHLFRAVTAQPVTSSTHSSPIAITSDNKFVWSANPDNNSVSVFEVIPPPTELQKVAEVPVGTEPWCVAITPDNAKVYVTNQVSGTVSVINQATRAVLKTVKVGTEPFGCALTPDGSRLYVTNISSDNVSVIDTATDTLLTTIQNVGPRPRGIAITGDGLTDGLTGELKVYVTQFLSERPADNDPRPLTQSEGRDDGRVGRVTVIDATLNQVIKTIVLNPLANVGGFLSDGSTLDREPLTGVFDNVTGAFPNLLESIVIKGTLAYLPNTCSSPNGPFRFGDVVGPDRVYKVLSSMYRIYGDPRYRPNIWLTRRAKLGVSLLTPET